MHPARPVARGARRPGLLGRFSGQLLRAPAARQRRHGARCRGSRALRLPRPSPGARGLRSVPGTAAPTEDGD